MTKRGEIEEEERVEGDRGEKEGRDREEIRMIIVRGKVRSGKRQGGRDRGTETEEEREWEGIEAENRGETDRRDRVKEREDR